MLLSLNLYAQRGDGPFIIKVSQFKVFKDFSVQVMAKKAPYCLNYIIAPAPIIREENKKRMSPMHLQGWDCEKSNEMDIVETSADIRANVFEHIPDSKNEWELYFVDEKWQKTNSQFIKF